MIEFVSDVKASARSLLRHPLYPPLSIFVFALGIGANTAVFRFVEAVLARPLAITEPERTVAVLYGTAADLTRNHLYADFRHYRKEARSFSDLVAVTSTRLGFSSGSDYEVANCEFVSPEYFRFLGVKASIGSAGFDRDEPVAVLSASFWRRRFSGAPDVAGRSFILNDRRVTVIGVADERFRGLEIETPPDAWLSMDMYPTVAGLSPESRAQLFAGRSNESFAVYGRLRSGVTVTAAEQEVRALYSQVNNGPMRWWAERGSDIRVVPVEAAQLLPGTRAPMAEFMMLIFLAAGLTLIAACVNAATLLLARFLDRSAELGIRMALGAGRVAVVRRMVVESTMIALTGGAAGLILSGWCAMWLGRVTLLAGSYVRFEDGLDWRTCLFATALALVCGICAGVVPAIRATQLDITAAIKSRLGVHGRHGTLHDLLLTAQVASSFVLAVSAVLLVGSLQRALRVDLGFQSRDALVVTTTLRAPEGMIEETGRLAYAELLQRIRALPDVQSVSVAASMPLGPRKWIRQVQAGADAKPVDVDGNAVAGGFFDTMGIQILAGRAIEGRDVDAAAAVAVVNAAFAARYWPDGGAVGKTFRMPLPGRSALQFEVIGVAQDGKYRSIQEKRRDFIYVPMTVTGLDSSMNLVVRPRRDARGVMAAVREAVQRSAPVIQVSGAMPLAELVSRAMLRQDLGSRVLGIAAGVGLLLAVLGTFSIAAYSVSRRTAEIGTRMVLGARPARIVPALIARPLVCVCAGVMLGAVAAGAASRILVNRIYGVEGAGLDMQIAVGLIVAVACGVACCVPAVRASRADPLVALRAD